ncbi:kinase-like domain-containing protein [Penicillium angulare]|uniref:Kinase-like domain-containing protein n=1 Tax=Penicillium angulare TaxID=116970 RepID=A0A9W9K9B1_9EURO|nr:kinase-like domain-containing protein [Penicillium angulare]
MKRLSHIFKTPIFRSRLQPREFSPGPLLNSIDKLEEERLPWYSEKNFFPVKIGDIYSSRYQVVGKLGYGGYSTVWLCRDLKKHSFVTLKLFEPNSSHAKREIEAYEHLKRLKSKHTGTLFVRSILDKFQLSSLDNSTSHSYQCLIHPPLAMSLYELRRKTPEHSLPEDLLKPALIHLLLALDFLHTEAHMIHTDIQEKNIMLSIEEESILLDFENAEISSPSPRKQVQDRSIYLSRKLGIPKIHGRPVLADFGEARFGSECGMYKGDVQPFIYRAPEVVLRLPWND